MKEERKQDLGGANDEALEQHVREMLDITLPDQPEADTKPATKDAATPKKAKPAPKKGVSINVIDHTEPEPGLVEPAEPDPELAAAIAETNAQLTQQTTAPLLESAPKSASKGKKVTVLHSDELDEEPQAEDTPVLDETTSAPEIEEAEPTVEEQVEAPAEPILDLDPIIETKPDPSATIGSLLEESPLEGAIESPETEKAVSDIIATESDELLAVHDTKIAKASKPKKKKRGIKGFFSAWAHSSAARWFTFLVLVAAAITIFAIPTSRYYVLNHAGVRSSASVTVTDQSTLQPLKNVTVKLAGQTVQTDAAGKAQFTQLMLGPTDLVIEKRAFAESRHAITIGWGSNPLASISLKPTGSQYTFIVTDVFSGKPITTAEATVGESSSKANEKGEIKLTLAKVEEPKVSVSLKAAGYREETVELELTKKTDTAVTLISAHKVAFVSKRTGKYSVYKIDADGKNESLVLTGTGKEAADITLASHPTDDVAVLVSTRDGKRANNGTLLQSLTYINLKDGSTKPVSESTQIKLVDWIGTRIVYVQLTTDAGNEDPQRYKLMSYDYISGDNRQLATSNYFNDIISAGGKIYYAPTSAYQNGINTGVFIVYADGSGKQPLLNQESWNMFRTSYDKITMAVQQDWYEYVIGDKNPTKLDGQPSSTMSRVYVDSPDGKHSVYIDNRDGKGTLIVYDTQAKSESTLYATNGLRGPVRWLDNNTLIYRLATTQETADYALSIVGGSPKKIIDTTNTTGIDRWSY